MVLQVHLLSIISIIKQKGFKKSLLKAVIRIKTRAPIQSIWRRTGLRRGGGLLSEASDVSAMLTLIEVSSKVRVIASHGLPPGIRR